MQTNRDFVILVPPAIWHRESLPSMKQYPNTVL